MTEETPSLKIKRSKSPVLSLDPRYLDIITTLNDKVIAEAFKEKDIPTCLSLLQQLEHSVKVIRFLDRTDNTEHILQAKNINTITCLSINTTLPWCIKKITIIIKRKIIYRKLSTAISKFRDLLPIEKKI